ncbi:probable serine/threonine-protein kinase DDB_G0282963 isoform X2 [Contarinia nasturtii]|uniref:probable serine/threonine-protein kinase DDB_G0282963 isoform X2 n=1 Tax=Contarinia nasturtii TaxID=265458 RepID=UPI0012D463A0|nr:probable serine/threonine-protein kinase DDB_G0282963 isoform X2 [Contarinia nasturtii]
MIRYKFLLFLILLPILTKSKNVHQNYPSSLEDDENAPLPFLDQVAQANTWKSQNRVISATYTGDPQTGRVDHANLVINVVPRTSVKPADVDLYASHTLANAKTAEEYVNKALEMKTKYDHTTPSSSFVKYDIYEAEKTKLVPVVSTPSHVTEPMSHKEDVSDMTKSASDFSEYSLDHPQEYVHQTTTTTYKHPALSTQFKDLDSSNSDYNHNYNYLSSIAHHNYDPYDSIKHINHDNRNNMDDVMRKLAGYPSKEDMIKYIERAVKKYLREFDLAGRLTSSPSSPLSGSSSAQAEIKTYYRFPSSTTASPIESTKLYNAGIHSEFFKPTKGSSSKPSYSTIKPFTFDYSPEGVDLTIPSKKRPKPLDLSALDVGQSWSHPPSAHASEPVVTYRKKKKPKIHMNSQTYQDINSLPYLPNRGLIYDEYSPFSTATSIIDHPSGNSHYSSHKDHPVGASISFGGHSHESKRHRHHGHGHHHSSHSHHHDHDEKSNFVPSIDIFDGGAEKNKFSFTDDFGPSTGAIWNPYNIDLNTLTRDSSGSGSSSTYAFDSYNPKFNNNPEDTFFDQYRFGVSDWDTDGYPSRQRGTIGSDMFTSGTAQRSKKVPSPNSKRAVTKLIPKPKQRAPKRITQSKEPDRDLMPPPAKI